MEGAATDRAQPAAFGWRVVIPRWPIWLLSGMAAWFILRLAFGGFDPLRASLLLVVVVEIPLLLWTRRVLVVELQVEDRDLVASTRSAPHQIDLSRTPVVAVTKRRTFHRMCFEDGTWFRIAIQTRGWPTFVSARERAQGSPIDQSSAGRIAKSSRFTNQATGYFEKL